MKNKYSWQHALSNLVTDPQELLALLNLNTQDLPQHLQAALSFPLKVPRSYLSRIEKGNPQDPLLLQILPSGLELESIPGYEIDPLNESAVNPIPGLLHKYDGRVLVTLTSACAIHCRYCFRRHFPYRDNQPGTQGWVKIADYIRQDVSISELILSGGDPLTVSDHLLSLFSQHFKDILHLKTFRIHTRTPVVMPERITDSFLTWLQSLPWQTIIVLHVNHAQEINDEVKNALLALKHAGVILLNQSVLLRGVNDHVQALVDLSQTLFTAGVLPYYLHLLDKVQGAQHFDLPLITAKTLHQEMTKKLPGYLVPRLTREQPGQASKTVISSTDFATG